MTFVTFSTGNAYPIGGFHLDPVTNLPIAIELGSSMIDPVTQQPVPIIGVTLDPSTGAVIPVGGTVLEDPESPLPIPVLLYDSFVEAVSEQVLKVTSARFSDVEEATVERCGGGFRALMDVNELYHESKVLDALRDLNEGLTGAQSSSGRHEENILETCSKDLSKARTRIKTIQLRDRLDLAKRTERASVLCENGGSPGMYEYVATGQLLPILVGTTMKDPFGSGLDVPILGVEKKKDGEGLIPLGGSVEDPYGDGLVAINIGDKVVDPILGKLSTVVGARYNHELGATEPVTSLSSQKQRKKKPPHGSVRLHKVSNCLFRPFFACSCNKMNFNEVFTKTEFCCFCRRLSC